MILIFYIFLESLEQKEADCTIFAKKFCIDFRTDAFKEIVHILEIFLHILICRVKGFSKMYNSSYFVHIFCLITWFCNKYLKFYKFAKFWQIIKAESEGFPKMY